MERCPDDAVVHRHVDDVRLTVHVLTTLRQKTHPDLQQSPPYHSTVADSRFRKAEGLQGAKPLWVSWTERQTELEVKRRKQGFGMEFPVAGQFCSSASKQYLQFLNFAPRLPPGTQTMGVHHPCIRHCYSSGTRLMSKSSAPAKEFWKIATS